VVGLFSVIKIGLFFAQFKRMRREERESWGNRSGASKYGFLQRKDCHYTSDVTPPMSPCIDGSLVRQGGPTKTVSGLQVHAVPLHIPAPLSAPTRASAGAGSEGHGGDEVLFVKKTSRWGSTSEEILTRKNFTNPAVWYVDPGSPKFEIQEFLRAKKNLISKLEAIRYFVYDSDKSLPFMHSNKFKHFILCVVDGRLYAYTPRGREKYAECTLSETNDLISKALLSDSISQPEHLIGKEAIQRLAQDNGIQPVGGAGGSAGVGTGSGAADSASAVGEDQATQYDMEEQLADPQNPSFLITVKAVAVQETRVTCPIKKFGMDIFLSDRNPSKLITAFLSRHEDLRQNLIAVRCLHSRQQLYFLCFMDDEKIKVYRWRRSAELPFDSDEQAFELVVKNRHALDNIGFQMIRKTKSSGK